jgi:putative peptidoglycan lipid II flippase
VSIAGRGAAEERSERGAEQLSTVTAQPSLARASGSMAVATLVSRLTGLGSKLLLAYVIGLGVLNDSYTVANTLPNIVYELLLGGVLTSVVVPVLVRAQKEDADGGLGYTQRLVTVAGVVLAAATVLAVLAAPLITRLYLDDSTGQANPALATAFAYLLLPEIIFYGLGALFAAILNARGVFGPPAWAPVLNNLVVIATLGVYTVVPGEISLNPVQMGNAKLLVLGIGTTLGIAVQAVVLLPALLRSGFTFRWRLGWDARLSAFGGMALWVVGYVLVSQVGYVVTTRVASAASAGSVATYSYAWLLLQVPYGVLGVSLLTAIMPRMSRSAADGDVPKVVADLSLGSRVSAVMLVPFSALLTVLGTATGVALFSLGSSSVDAAGRLGDTLAVSAFGLLPFAVVMLQLRVFYALHDARTPTLINVVMIAVKVPLMLACPLVLAPERVVLGLAVVNSVSFVVGAIVGEVWLWIRLGRLETTRVLATVARTAVAGLAVAVAVLALEAALDALLADAVGAVTQAWILLLLGGAVGAVVALAAMALLRVDELRPVLARFARLTGRSR